MKKQLFASFIMISLAFAGFSQSIPPPYINYQTVLYDANGANPNAPLTNQSFTTFVNINDELGNLLYEEEHYASTDANGLITVKMGDGLYTAGSITNFNQINCGVGKYYLVVDFNITGTISSTAPEQLVTVPYSYFAGKAGNGMTAVADNGNGTLTFTYANGQTYITPVLAGITGAQGPIGLTGPTGPTGAQGIQGVQGPVGPLVAGANGQTLRNNGTAWIATSNLYNSGTAVGIGTNTPAASAQLDVSSTERGFLLPRMTNAQRDLIATPEIGLLVFQTDNTAGYYFYNGTAWVALGGASVSNGGVGANNIQAFITNTSFTVPSGVTRIIIEAWGAGGGGGGNCSPNAAGAIGGGGGSGAYVKKSITVVEGQTYAITIGQGGASGGSTAQNVFTQTGSGASGGNTSFGNLLTVAGGSGGGGANCIIFQYVGGSGGSPGSSSEVLKVDGNGGSSGCYYNSNSQTYCFNGKGGVNNAAVSGYLGIGSIGKGGDGGSSGTQGALIIYY